MKSSGEESCRVKKERKRKVVIYGKQTGIKKMSCGKKMRRVRLQRHFLLRRDRYQGKEGEEAFKGNL